MTHEIGNSSAAMPAHLAGQGPANARNTTVPPENSFSAVLETADTAATSPAPRAGPSAQKQAEYWANFAESLLAMIGEAMVNHNRHLDQMENHWANIARISGPEAAAKLKAADTTLSRHEKIIRAARGALKGKFSVTGKIAMKDAEGNYHFGDFVLSRMGKGFVLKIDSSVGASVIYGSGSASVGISTLESAFLPWNMDDEEMEKEKR